MVQKRKKKLKAETRGDKLWRRNYQIKRFTDGDGCADGCGGETGKGVDRKGSEGDSDKTETEGRGRWRLLWRDLYEEVLNSKRKLEEGKRKNLEKEKEVRNKRKKRK